jgi:hypothetical protein
MHTILRRCRVAVLVVVAGLLAVRADAASLLPLVTEEVETLPQGAAELVLGAAYTKDELFPAFTPDDLLDSQHLVAVPQLTFRIAAGSWAEIQASYELLYLDEEARNGQSNSQYGSGDARLYTKVRILLAGEILPALGFRFGAKLPNADRSDRLGTDETDFDADVLLSQDYGFAAAHVNLGMLLLGNGGPTVAGGPNDSGQDDLFTYSVAAVSAPLGQGGAGAATVRLLGEVAGQEGSRFDNDRAAIRLGAQMSSGAATVYLGVSAGLVDDSEDVGVSGGFVYTFEPAQLFGSE